MRALSPAEHLGELEDAVDDLLGRYEVSDPAVRPGLWRALSEAGFTLLSIPERAGGSGGDLADAAAVLRRCGYAGVRLPLVETLLAAWLCEQVDRPVPEGMSACGVAEAGTATRLAWAGAADDCVVLVHTDGAYSVSPAATVATAETTLAGEPVGTATAGQGTPTSVRAEELRLRGAVLRAAMLLGAAQRALDLAVQYSGERVQFGKPIRAFQAVGHLLAGCAGQVVATSVALDAALASLSDPGCEPERQEVAALVAVVEATQMAGRLAAATHQVHGAIGFTAEHPLHLSTTALWSWRDDYGNEFEWASRLARIATAHGRDAWDLLAD
ncbi:acyl-CoA dehydrogenase [Micromonospora sp. NPDC007271]|uniref:acyl-CoA dehydrogenase n=1 Tax=Micromonospora sp. NPDC007271 TaxID=3154587 RepID=UPI00340129C8